jgi:ectoine hydroxylase-related dioxygenase (phytanoyl-CoA dioxygenase family)
VPGAVDAPLVQAMVAAEERIIERAHAGEFGDDVRGFDRERRLPGFQNDLLTPEKCEPAFAEFLDQVIVPAVEDLLQEPVRCSWLLLLTAGAGYPTGVPLHRDHTETGQSGELETIEQYRMKNSLFMAPLLPDDRFLFVVPGSHRRRATAAEVAASTSLGPCAADKVPGMIRLEMQPGDVLYHHTDLLHQGHNPTGLPRWTLISSHWVDSMPMHKIEVQNRAEICAPGFIQAQPPRLRAAMERYMQAYERQQQQPDPPSAQLAASPGGLSPHVRDLVDLLAREPIDVQQDVLRLVRIFLETLRRNQR